MSESESDPTTDSIAIEEIESHVAVPPQQLQQLLDGRVDSIRVPDVGTQGNTTPLSEVELDREFNLIGVVCNVGDINEFSRKDGGQGQVRNIRIQDRTGSLRLALWGEEADKRLNVGDTIHVTNVEIQDGFKDTFEGSVGYDSFLKVVREPDDPLQWITISLDNSGPDTE